MNPLRILIGDCRETLKTLPDESMHCCVTSPPYWGLRDYGHVDQLGLEKTPEEYVANMVQVFREVRRVLRSDGTLWLNLGDSYANDTKWGGSSGGKHVTALHGNTGIGRQKVQTGLKAKDLVGIPWMVAFALRADGWYLRQWMPWVKRNAMPESVQDRPSTSCETFFLLTKTASYFYDAQAVKMTKAQATSNDARTNSDGERRNRAFPGSPSNGGTNMGGPSGGRSRRNGDWFFDSDWQGMQTDEDGWPVAMVVNPQPYAEAHFATFPPKLVQPCILAGTSAKGCCPACGTPWTRIVDDCEPDIDHQRACGGDERGLYDGQSTKDYAAGGAQDASATKSRILAGMKKRRTIDWSPGCKCEREDVVPCVVIDPFGGSGTTGKVAIENGRNAILCELNPEYAPLIEQRTSTTRGLGI